MNGEEKTEIFKCPELRAFDKWRESSFGQGCFNAATLGTQNPDKYLANRIEGAFLAGVAAGKEIAAAEPTAEL